MDKKIKVGITHGDINGVGYEVIFKTLSEEGITDLFTPVVFGLPEIVNKTREAFELPSLKLNIIDSPKNIKEGEINIVNIKGYEPELHPGEIWKDAGESAAIALERSVEALKNEEIDVLVTAPISKESIQSEKFNFPGHTEFLSERLGGGAATMILCNDKLRVALLTVHMPLSKVTENITKEKIIEVAGTFIKTLKEDFGIVRPSIAVLSLNPHSGDGGLLGKEEEEILKPAIEELTNDGKLVFGPFAADGFFGHSQYKKFDGVLAMYHDQGLAPFKTIASGGGVNYSSNLPYIRTSPDHGTAFDIAWKGVADPTSFREAIYMAIDLYRNRKRYETASANPLKKFVHERPEKFDKSDKNTPKPVENTEKDD